MSTDTTTTQAQDAQIDEKEKDDLLEPIEESLDLIEVPLNLKAKDGSTLEYIMREPVGSERDKYMNALGRRVKADEHGNSRVTNFDGMQADLICKIVFERVSGKAVTPAIVQGWPARIQEKVFARCQKLAALNSDKETAKK